MSRLRYGRGTLGLELLIIAVAVAFIFPVYVLITIAFKSPPEVAAAPLAIPERLFVDNFSSAWEEASLAKALLSSTIVTTLSVLLLVAFGSAAAYALVRGGRKLDDILLMLFILGITIPLQLGMVPLYQLMRDLGLLQSYTSLIMFHTGTLLPVTVFLYAGFIRVQDRGYEEAALMDGANQFQTFSKVVFPLLRPVTGTVIVLNAINVWNDFLTPLLYLGGTDKRTLPVSIFAFQGEYATQWGMIFAGLLIAVIPILVVYFLLQKYIIKGFASGLKG